MTPGSGIDKEDSGFDLRRAFAVLTDRFDQQTVEIERLKAESRELRDEIARLKGMPKRPKFPPKKPSGMEKATSEPAGDGGGKGGKDPKERSQRRRGSKNDKLTVTREVLVKAIKPEGSTFQYYEEVLVQDLKIEVETIRYRREVWLGPNGERIVAPLPAGIKGGYGPQVRCAIVAGHALGQVSSERLTALLNGLGLSISKRQVVRLMSKGLEDLIAEDEAVLQAGLEAAAWVTVDDTGHRHAGKNGYVTHIGNDAFAVFRASPSKSRVNFLELLRAGASDYAINAHALDYMRAQGMAEPQIEILDSHPDKAFACEAAWLAHLAALDMDQFKSVKVIATEAALWGAIKALGLLGDTVIVSDGAGQFRLDDRHALCWVHAERLVHKLSPTWPADIKAQEHRRTLIWNLYRALKAYRENPNPKRAKALSLRFDRIFTAKTGYDALDQLLGRLHGRKAELLKVLERPEIPTHTNGSENDIRAWVTKRKISGGTVSDDGKAARQASLGLAKTCAKLGVSFYQYLADRLAVPGAPSVPSLPNLVKMACA
jgi:hypothetical protein